MRVCENVVRSHLIIGHIKCISEGDFSSTNNEALLEFATGDSAMFLKNLVV